MSLSVKRLDLRAWWCSSCGTGSSFDVEFGITVPAGVTGSYQRSTANASSAGTASECASRCHQASGQQLASLHELSRKTGFLEIMVCFINTTIIIMLIAPKGPVVCTTISRHSRPNRYLTLNPYTGSSNQINPEGFLQLVLRSVIWPVRSRFVAGAPSWRLLGHRRRKVCSF